MFNRSSNQEEVYQQNLEEYRRSQEILYQRSQEDYDKTVIALSGGALGLTFSFIDGFISGGKAQQLGYLLAAWGCWGLSVSCCLASYYFSTLALRRVLIQLNNNEEVSPQNPGDLSARITQICNFTSGFLFLLGVRFIIIFVYYNLET